jgi:hypothetical protein
MGAREHQKKRNWDDSYLQFGFACVGDYSAPGPVCFVLAKFSKQLHGSKKIA